MLKIKEKQLSFYSVLYEKIPENHLLKRIVQAVDFSFINELLADSYCKDFGRPAKEPEMMMKEACLSRMEECRNEVSARISPSQRLGLAKHCLPSKAYRNCGKSQEDCSPGRVFFPVVLVPV